VKYRTIVADPPWEYDGGFATLPGGLMKRGGKPFVKPLPYPSMALAEIRALPIQPMAEAGCWLFLWTTNRYLPKSFDILAAWGFEYRQTLVWHKTGNPSPFGGAVAPNHAEFLLVARQGNARLNGRLASSVIAVNKPQNHHSAKPECFLDYIEQVSPGPYLELFARRNRLGWDTWGNEALEHVEMPT